MDEYKKYLENLDLYLKKFFEQQKPYIFCKKGCSRCCSNAQYPLTKLEWEYLQEGLKFLSKKEITEIKSNIIKKYPEKESFDKDYTYICPLLKGGSCLVYKYRPLVCRVFGIMRFYENEKGEMRYMMPECVNFGLNYSNVYDPKKHEFDQEKIKKIGAEFEPQSYNLSLKFLQSPEFSLDLNFGKTKMLIDWLYQEF